MALENLCVFIFLHALHVIYELNAIHSRGCRGGGRLLSSDKYSVASLVRFELIKLEIASLPKTELNAKRFREHLPPFSAPRWHGMGQSGTLTIRTSYANAHCMIILIN